MFELMFREYFEPHRQETLGKYKVQLCCFPGIFLLFLSTLAGFFFFFLIKTNKQINRAGGLFLPLCKPTS